MPSPSPALERTKPVASASSDTGRNTAWPLWSWAIPVALALLGLAFAFLRRRSTYSAQESTSTKQWQDEQTPVAERSPPVIESPLAPPVLPEPVIHYTTHPAQELARTRVSIAFRPLAMRLSLVYATLQFRLQLTAQTAIPEGRLLGDMISAHGSLSQAAQLSPPLEVLATLNPIPAMAPGQTYEIAGELRLALNAVRPVRQGNASFVAPLVRLALLGNGAATEPHLELGCVFTVGIPGDGAGMTLLRLDTGPRDFISLSAREIGTAKRATLLPLDHIRAAG